MNANLIFANAEREAHSNLPEGGFMSLLVSPVKSMPRKHSDYVRELPRVTQHDCDKSFGFSIG